MLIITMYLYEIIRLSYLQSFFVTLDSMEEEKKIRVWPRLREKIEKLSMKKIIGEKNGPTAINLSY